MNCSTPGLYVGEIVFLHSDSGTSAATRLWVEVYRVVTQTLTKTVTVTKTVTSISSTTVFRTEEKTRTTTIVKTITMPRTITSIYTTTRAITKERTVTLFKTMTSIATATITTAIKTTERITETTTVALRTTTHTTTFTQYETVHHVVTVYNREVELYASIVITMLVAAIVVLFIALIKMRSRVYT